MFIHVGLTLFHFVGQFWDLVATVVVVLLFGPTCGASGAEATAFYDMLVAILALQISLSSIVSTIGSGVVDGAT